MATEVSEECIHGLDRTWCTLCKHPRKHVVRDSIERTFSARYTSRCPDCGELIEPGDIVHLLMPSGHVIHEDCP